MKSGLSLTEWENTHWIHWSWHFTQDMIRHWGPRNQSSVKSYKINVQCPLKSTQSPGFDLPNHFSYAKWTHQHNVHHQNLVFYFYLTLTIKFPSCWFANFLFPYPIHIPNYFSTLCFTCFRYYFFLQKSMYKYTEVTKFHKHLKFWIAKTCPFLHMLTLYT